MIAIMVGSMLASAPASAETLDADATEQGGPISFGWLESEGFEGAYASLQQQNSAEASAAYLKALSTDSALDPQSIGFQGVDIETARDTLAAAADAAEDGVAKFDAPTSGGTEVGAMSVSSAPVLGYATNSRYSWRYDDTYTQRYCDNWLLPWTCSDSTLSMRFVTDPGNRGSRTSLNFLEGGQGRVTSAKLRSVVYSGGSNISDVTNTWNTPGTGTQWNNPHAAAAGKTFQVWFTMTIRHSQGDPITVEWKTAKSATCRTPTSTVAFRCLFPA